MVICRRGDAAAESDHFNISFTFPTSNRTALFRARKCDAISRVFSGGIGHLSGRRNEEHPNENSLFGELVAQSGRHHQFN